MLVLFNEDGREYLRVFAQATEEQREKGIEIDERDIPNKEGFNTIITRKGDEVEYIYEEIPKSENEKIKERLEALEESFLCMLGGE